jgi:selenocysteine-specific elongation factor
MYVIGTAGHVDHGKSALVRALTGTDPDRLREEKERGLTIDLGFAWLPMPSGGEVGIVDVPGHERFIKNMLAGVAGIDLALLVVAADEGVMPQTLEHLAILDLLGIERGVVAVTKTDLVDRELAELAAADVQEALQGTTLEGSPLVRCSAVSGQGLEELTATLRSTLAETAPKRDAGRPRLPIDRAFTVAGFGTVVTGTLASGSLTVGQEVEVLPGGLRSRVRGLQEHGTKVETAAPGRRTAVNLADLAVEQLARGMVVASPGWLRPATALDVRLRAVRHLRRPLRHGLNVTLHTGAAEVEGRLLLLDREELPPGETCWAQLRLKGPAAALKGDRFVVRDPNDTLGGGVIVDTAPTRHKRFHAPTLERLTALERGSPSEAVAMAVAAAEPLGLPDLAGRLDLPPDELPAALDTAVASGEVLALDDGLLFSSRGFDSLTERMHSVASEHHARFPLRRGVPREELRSRLGLDARAFEAALALWRRRGDAQEAGDAVALPGHVPSPTDAQRARAEELLAALRAQPFSPPLLRGEDQLVAYLEDAGQVVRLEDGVVFAADAYAEAEERVVAHLRERGTVTLAQVRDLLGTSRRYAQALLERMDGRRVTRRVGDERVLREASRR